MVRKHGDRSPQGVVPGMVLEVLRRHCDEEGIVRMSVRTIGHRMDMGHTAAANGVVWLLRAGLLELVEPGGPYVPAEYRVVGLSPSRKTSKTVDEWKSLAMRGKVYHRSVDIDYGITPATFADRQKQKNRRVRVNRERKSWGRVA